jgi:hypothetical protein
MAFKDSSNNVIISNRGEILHYSYDATTTPSNETKITASDGAAGDQFGCSVAVGSGRIVVGARRDDDNGSSSGSAYIFDLDGTQLAKITASDGATGDSFGNAVAVGSGRIVVGATGDDDNGTSSGSAYIWNTPSMGSNYDSYIESVVDSYKGE